MLTLADKFYAVIIVAPYIVLIYMFLTRKVGERRE